MILLGAIVRFDLVSGTLPSFEPFGKSPSSHSLMFLGLLLTQPPVGFITSFGPSLHASAPIQFINRLQIVSLIIAQFL